MKEWRWGIFGSKAIFFNQDTTATIILCKSGLLLLLLLPTAEWWSCVAFFRRPESIEFVRVHRWIARTREYGMNSLEKWVMYVASLRRKIRQSTKWFYYLLWRGMDRWMAALEKKMFEFTRRFQGMLFDTLLKVIYLSATSIRCKGSEFENAESGDSFVPRQMIEEHGHHHVLLACGFLLVEGGGNNARSSSIGNINND